MTLNDAQLTGLKAEIDTDPKTLGYAGKNNPEIATLLNEIGLVTPNETIDIQTIDGQNLSAAVVKSEYTALTAADQRLWTTILSAGSGQIDVSDTGIRTQIGAIWGAVTTTRANLVALQTRVCSRVETLFGLGASVTHSDVAKAVLYG